MTRRPFQCPAPTVLAALVIAATLVGCARPDDQAGTDQTPARDSIGAPAPGDVPASADSLAAVRDAVREAVGEASCTDAGQCRTIAYGAKPCGGPWSYLVYSTAETDSARLTELVTRYNAIEQALNEAEDRVSDCRAVMRPEVACRQGVCTAVEPMGADIP
jgi:hypothetical protein